MTGQVTGPGAMADLSWLLDNFADSLRGIAHVVVVSADGLLLSASRDLPPDRAEQLAAITAGLVSLAYGTSRYFDGGDVQQTIVEMGAGYLIMMSIGDGSALVVLASRHCDVGHVGYEMALLVERVGKALNPLPRDSYAY
jgi:predicted regulator of Ras-like GTPase activity (Roadblock/LC7/MglB family)